MSKFRVIAIYLPQFHPFPENDEWWGKGFTEWTNVTKAKPRFKGHYQPHLPSDLGFYDLRLPEVREAQAELAKEAGIYGFCYYHYWFNGKVLMERPLKEVLENGKPDFPFMICWANENWTRAWDGGENKILIQQNYSDEDARDHIKWLLPYLKDHRYIRINNKPVIALYRTNIIPNLESMIRIWRNEALKEGLELYICRVESNGAYGKEYLIDGLDAAIDFQPHNKRGFNKRKNILKRAVNKIHRKLFKGTGLFAILQDYNRYVDYIVKQDFPDYKQYPCITPSWDNSPRRGRNYFAFKNSTPKKYYYWLKKILDKFKPYSKEENLIFINAWNEWAEGNHLEPDQKWGRAYLEETKKAIEDAENES
ncbi:MAG: glycoside hydrolase family 99-like domain-containing protein [Muribaculaceae bacterium]|nr:glycoside hydrolase family 99-like domain-containing protein [Muribaculaceae bacterium]